MVIDAVLSPVYNAEGKKIADFNTATKELLIKKGRKLTVINFGKSHTKVLPHFKKRSYKNGGGTKMQFLYKKRLSRKTVRKTGVEGIEPSLKVLETSVIPFDHTPMSTTILF